MILKRKQEQNHPHKLKIVYLKIQTSRSTSKSEKGPSTLFLSSLIQNRYKHSMTSNNEQPSKRSFILNFHDESLMKKNEFEQSQQRGTVEQDFNKLHNKIKNIKNQDEFLNSIIGQNWQQNHQQRTRKINVKSVNSERKFKNEFSKNKTQNKLEFRRFIKTQNEKRNKITQILNNDQEVIYQKQEKIQEEPNKNNDFQFKKMFNLSNSHSNLRNSPTPSPERRENRLYSNRIYRLIGCGFDESPNFDWSKLNVKSEWKLKPAMN